MHRHEGSWRFLPQAHDPGPPCGNIRAPEGNTQNNAKIDFQHSRTLRLLVLHTAQIPHAVMLPLLDGCCLFVFPRLSDGALGNHISENDVDDVGDDDDDDGYDGYDGDGDDNDH